MMMQAELMDREPSFYTSLTPQEMEVSRDGLHSDVPTLEVRAKHKAVGMHASQQSEGGTVGHEYCNEHDDGTFHCIKTNMENRKRSSIQVERNKASGVLQYLSGWDRVHLEDVDY